MGILSEKSDINSLKEWVCLWRFEKTQKTRDNRKKKKKENRDPFFYWTKLEFL